jgi:hypothetical protein
MTIAQIKDTINNTKWIVDDVFQSNGGVGTAAYGPNHTGNEEHFNYWALSPDNPQSYAAPTYNGQGVVAMVLHETAHMTEAGWAQDRANHTFYDRDTPHYSSFNDSAYWKNNEDWAHDFEVSVAVASNIHVEQYERAVLGYYTEWHAPNEIYESHHGIGLVAQEPFL